MGPLRSVDVRLRTDCKACRGGLLGPSVDTHAKTAAATDESRADIEDGPCLGRPRCPFTSFFASMQKSEALDAGGAVAVFAT